MPARQPSLFGAKSIIIALLLLFALLQYELWFSHGSILSSITLFHQIQAKQAENQQLHQKNLAIMADIQELQQGNQAVEERARKELGLIRAGEQFYQIAPAHD